ncbi:sensor histidine kinase [Sinomicrobium soli]|uniref:sensor histidine kinase n=1 Tax=Sinomicrobium sp. N-1-3-6 TaxID=2219864 RepID=UPI000DCD450B|nr:7TM-DISM domain-containing protein [Sinomicrobium sp. N-1-3-6]RAV27639.1 hypothetical protein DN748_17795 [Sinomicrobium sp. N-1-3-6]
MLQIILYLYTACAFNLAALAKPLPRVPVPEILQDIFAVSGANTEHLSGYVSYYIDHNRNSNAGEVYTALEQGKFRKWPENTTLNIGLNPYPLWLHLEVANTTSEARTYWWSLYNQADSVLVYNRSAAGSFALIDSLSYRTPVARRETAVRFQAIPLHFEGHEHRTLLVKVINLRTPQYFVTDFTLPSDNLLWEKDFYWSVGVFAGCFLAIMVMSLLIGAVASEKAFYRYGLYLLAVLFLILYQELLITILPERLYLMLSRIHPLTAVLLALYLHFHVVCYVLNIRKEDHRLYRALYSINHISLYYTLLTGIVYFVFINNLSVAQWPFLLFFYLSVALVFIQLLLIFLTIMGAVKARKYILLHLSAAFVVVYFNPAGYYLNYDGFINYYRITYPNYFYWIMCTEIMILGALVSWRYRWTLKRNYTLMSERAQLKKKAYIRELEIQEDERKKIAQDLHDDLGATLSAIRLVVTNNYSNDSALVRMITKANHDLRHFFKQLIPLPLKGGSLFQALDSKTAELNRLGETSFSFIPVGDDTLVPDNHVVSLYRVSVELLTNIAKHARAREATIQCIADREQLLIITEDDGTGFNIKRPGNGMGLQNVYDRVSRMGGDTHISSNSNGTTTIITIPLITITDDGSTE